MVTIRMAENGPSDVVGTVLFLDTVKVDDRQVVYRTKLTKYNMTYQW